MKSGVIVRMSERGTITIPKELRQMGLTSDAYEVVLREDGVFELRPQVMVDASQAWFWTKRWQTMEREADAEFAAGQIETFDDMESFLANLDAEAAKPAPPVDNAAPGA